MRRHLLLAPALLLAACTGQEGPTASQTRTGGTVAFEAIDGAPIEVRQRLAGHLAGEAQARRVALAAGSEARYRVRGYIATNRTAEGATVSYVWDVFDPTARRTTRISGEERVASGGQGWSGVDDGVTSRIAARSMSEIATFLSTPQPTSVAEAQPMPSPTPNLESPSQALAYAPEPVAQPTAAAVPAVTRPNGSTSTVTAFASPAASPAPAPPAPTSGVGGPLQPVTSR
ncbi:MAG: hypothetical protein WCH83_10650 [Alphaproteobacteria bacterium]